MPRHGIAGRHARRRRSGGGSGMPIRPGGRPRAGGSVAVNRVVGIGSVSASGGRRNRRPPRTRARVSAQPRLEKEFPAAVRAATSCSFRRGVARTSGSVHACAVRLYGASCSARRGGGDGVNGDRGVGVGFHPGARKYVATHCRSLGSGPIVVPLLRQFAAAILQDEWCHPSRATGKER